MGKESYSELAGHADKASKLQTAQPRVAQKQSRRKDTLYKSANAYFHLGKSVASDNYYDMPCHYFVQSKVLLQINFHTCASRLSE
jgi:hypothetical protein